MKNLSDGQLLAFVDGLVTENKIFNSTDDLNYWDQSKAQTLNSNFNIEKQKTGYLHNDESEFSIKMANCVKKLDNSI